jgi:hypothetical protein
MQEKEIWKDIPGYEGIYQVSDLGNVKSLKRFIKRSDGSVLPIKEKLLKPRVLNTGYFLVTLCYNGSKNQKLIHQLVAISFLNHKPDGWNIVVDHIDNDKSNNKLGNLQLITTRKNSSKDKKGGSSRYTGVWLNKHRNLWQCGIRVNNKLIHLGYFDSEEDASEAYQKKLKEIET